MDSTHSKETEDSITTNEEPMDVSVENSVTTENHCSGTNAENITEKNVESSTNSAEDETNSPSNHDIFENIQFVISDEPIENPTNESIMDTSEDKELVGSMSENGLRDVPGAIFILDPETIVISEDEEVETPNKRHQTVIVNYASRSSGSVISISDTEDETDDDLCNASPNYETPQVVGQIDLCDDTSSDGEYIVNLGPGPKSKTKLVRKRIHSPQNSKKDAGSMKKTNFLQREGQSSSSGKSIISPNNETNDLNEGNQVDTKIDMVDEDSIEKNVFPKFEGQSNSSGKSILSPNNETNDLNEGNQVDAEVDMADEDSIKKNVFPKFEGQFSSSGKSIMSPNNETNNLNQGNQVDTKIDMADEDSIEKNVFPKFEGQSNSSGKSILSPNNETNNLNEETKVDSEIDTAVNSIPKFKEVQSSLSSESIVLPNKETNKKTKEEN